MHVITCYDNRRQFGDVVDEVAYSWAELCAFLRECAEDDEFQSPPYDAADAASEKRAKAALPAWGPHRLLPGAKRARMGVVAVTVLAADIDGATQDEVDRIVELAAGRAVCVYGSPRDGKDGFRRVRLVGEPSREMTPAECDRARMAFAAALGFDVKQHGVDQALGPERLYFVGRMAGAPAREFGATDGEAWDVDALLASAPATTAPRSSGGGGARPAKVRAIVDALGDHHDHVGRRSNLCDAVGGLLRRGGATEAFCREVIETWLSGACEEQNDSKAIARGVARAAAAWSKAPHEVTGSDAFSQLLDDQAHADRVVAAIREATGVAQMMREVDTAIAPSATPIASPVDVPILLQSRKSPPSFFLFDPRTPTPTYLECGKHSLHRAIDEFAASYIPTSYKGKTLPITEILKDHAATVGGVEWDFGAPGGIVYDRAGDRMVGGIACPVIAARYDAGVEAWLVALTRDAAHLAALKEWIASTRQDTIHRLATCLLVVGPHSIGKTLLAVVCARLWGASVPVPLAHVVKQFNSSMATTPIVLDDEASTLARKMITTEDFRTLIQNRERNYEPKGHEMRRLHGAQRFVVTANDLDAFTFSNGAGVGAVEAVAERLLLIDVPADTAEPVRAALDALRDGNGEIDFGRLLGHFEHVRCTTVVPDGRVRFLGAAPDKAAAQTAVTTSIVQAAEALFEVVARVMTDGRPYGMPNDPAIFIQGGMLWARPVRIAETWAATHVRGPALTLGDVHKALSPFRGPRSCLRRGALVVKAWELDVPRLANALGLND